MLLSLAGGAAFALADTALVCDFSNGLPADFGVYDLDGNTPSADARSIGFAQGIGWIAYEESEGNKAACSVSWYSPAGQSDDWLITPAVTVATDGYVLRWRSRASDVEYADGYSVYVSAEGSTPECFSAAPVFSVEAESGEWTLHSVDLSAYGGQDIWVAFVNDSYNCNRLYVDDLYIGVDYITDFTLDLPSLRTEAEYAITGTVRNVSDADIQGFDISITAGDWNAAQHFDIAVEAGQTVDFAMAEPIFTPKHQIADYRASVIVEGQEQYVLSGTTAYVPHRVVAEEATGAWCGFCVRGTVALRDLSEQYPDNFIGIAVHHDDRLTCQEYDDALSSAFFVSSYPQAVFCRKNSTDPANLSKYVKERISLPEPAYVELGAAYSADTQTLDIDARMGAAEDLDYPLVLTFVIIENDVAMGGLYQYNGYAGGSQGEMGGYELLDEKVQSTDVPFQEVARAISGFYGIEESRVEALGQGEYADFQYQMEVPASVLDTANIELIALLLNADNGEILNAERIGAGQMGISSIAAETVESLANGEIYDLQGRPRGIDRSALSSGLYIQDGKIFLIK